MGLVCRASLSWHGDGVGWGRGWGLCGEGQAWEGGGADGMVGSDWSDWSAGFGSVVLWRLVRSWDGDGLIMFMMVMMMVMTSLALRFYVIWRLISFVYLVLTGQAHRMSIYNVGITAKSSPLNSLRYAKTSRESNVFHILLPRHPTPIKKENMFQKERLDGQCRSSPIPTHPQDIPHNQPSTHHSFPFLPNPKPQKKKSSTRRSARLSATNHTPFLPHHATTNSTHERNERTNEPQARGRRAIDLANAPESVAAASELRMFVRRRKYSVEVGLSVCVRGGLSWLLKSGMGEG